MGSVIILWIIIIIVFRAAKQSARNRNRNSGPTPNRPRSGGQSASRGNSSRTSTYRSVHSGTRPAKSQKQQTDSWHNEAEVTAGDISFRNLPPGTDELEMLIRHNTRYEKLLEARLASSEDRQ